MAYEDQSASSNEGPYAGPQELSSDEITDFTSAAVAQPAKSRSHHFLNGRKVYLHCVARPETICHPQHKQITNRIPPECLEGDAPPKTESINGRKAPTMTPLTTRTQNKLDVAPPNLMLGKRRTLQGRPNSHLHRSHYKKSRSPCPHSEILHQL